MNDEGNASPESTRPEIRSVEIGDLQQGPIQHETLPPELLDRIAKLHRFLGSYLTMTLEQFELGFMRDMHPEREIAIWSAIAFTFQNYVVQFRDGQPPPTDEGKELVRAILLISMGVSDPEQLNVPGETAHRLMACYQELFRKSQSDA